MVLSQYSEEIFLAIVVERVSVDSDTQELLSLWWQNNASTDRYIRRVELAVINCHSKPERSDGRRLARELRKKFNETNLLYSKLLGLKTNIFMELWFWPTVSFFTTRPEIDVINRLTESINSFENLTEDNDDDQLLATLEILASTPFDKLKISKQNMLQWSCEEFLRLYALAKFNHHAGLELGSTVDELDTEKQKFLRKLRRLRHAMDLFAVNKDAKLDMNFLIEGLTNDFNSQRSIFKAFERIENMYQILISDGTQKKFWDWELGEDDE
jgi:hypothetical protein